jgi:ArsR family transcriptional regulator, arsenate/arsenite/antimonite-responsive transcriptional repressor
MTRSSIHLVNLDLLEEEPPSCRPFIPEIVNADCNTDCNIGKSTPKQDVDAISSALAALAQGTRLSVFRLLVQAGPDGLPAGRISALLDIPSTTLSFHLSRLARVGLVNQLRDGRSIIYSANFEIMWGLIDFLSAQCCMDEEDGGS